MHRQDPNHKSESVDRDSADPQARARDAIRAFLRLVAGEVVKRLRREQDRARKPNRRRADRR